MLMLKFCSTACSILYCSAAILLLTYGLNCYVMVFLYLRKKRSSQLLRTQHLAAFDGTCTTLPIVTTQIPVYNEYNVVERAMRAACAMEYPRDRHIIQVLDDSTDETSLLIDKIAEDLRQGGHRLQVLHRKNRLGFKAGALAAGMAANQSEYFAIFDADFVPPSDYLQRTMPFFLQDAKLALIQTRWGHLNADTSLLTRVQSIGIDGHFMIEQAARNWNGLYMNFNGTAGIWRREAIEAGGGWQWDTLTEDMDLSYRVQFAGWQTLYIPEIVVPAEIPEDIGSFKSQQFRWAKGSVQTALKLLPQLWQTPGTPFKKLEAILHLTHYLIHPLMLTMAILALPTLWTLKLPLSPAGSDAIGALLTLSILAPTCLYLTSQHAAYTSWKKRLLYLPALISIGVGLAISNTCAIWQAVRGQKSEFIRTPKRGDKQQISYCCSIPGTALAEIVLGLYCAVSFILYLHCGKYLIGPFLAVYSIGFLHSGVLTLWQNLSTSRTKTRTPVPCQTPVSDDHAGCHLS
jgi:cellulose synthase/poly-beta-1,6-N-acetylglucosamine synthase-like glycosyltransferase